MPSPEIPGSLGIRIFRVAMSGLCADALNISSFLATETTDTEVMASDACHNSQGWCRAGGIDKKNLVETMCFQK